MRRVALATALAALPALPLAAKEKPPVFVESQAVKDKPVAAIDPAKAYVLLRSADSAALYLTKVPTAEDQAVYGRVRAAAFAETREKYVKKLVSYERDLKARASNPQLPRPDKPVEPTEANFAFTSFAMMAAVPIGPINRFAKAGFSTYVQEVTPGTYRVYGAISMTPNAGPVGTCFCMGSVLFDAKAGEITDLGVIPEQKPAKRPDGDSSWPGDLEHAAMFLPSSADMPVDARLSSFRVVAASFRPAGKMPNHLGVQVGRLPAMPGVMRYDRDRIVDLTAGR